MKKKYLYIELTPDEHKEAKKRAAASSLSLKDWICRAMVLKMQIEDLEDKKHEERQKML